MSQPGGTARRIGQTVPNHANARERARDVTMGSRLHSHVDMMLRPFLLVILVASSCGRHENNSSDTDKPGRDLTTAQTELVDRRRQVETNAEDVERRKRELLTAQQSLADREKVLAENRQQLGSAQATLVQARTAYRAGVTSRLAKVDADLADLAARTDAAAKDATVGLRARRDVLSTKIAAMPDTTAASWPGYVKEVDTAFDAIETDLHRAAD